MTFIVKIAFLLTVGFTTLDSPLLLQPEYFIVQTVDSFPLKLVFLQKSSQVYAIFEGQRCIFFAIAVLSMSGGNFIVVRAF